MQIESIASLAESAASLLPGPPPTDAVAYLDWRELVWDTAIRIAAIAGPGLACVAPSEPADVDQHVSGTALLGLAALVWGETPGNEAMVDVHPVVRLRQDVGRPRRNLHTHY